jgi:uncharacterized membrane protein YesL
MPLKDGRYVEPMSNRAKIWLMRKSFIFGFKPFQVIGFFIFSALIIWGDYLLSNAYHGTVVVVIFLIYFDYFLEILALLYLLSIVIRNEKEFKRYCGHYCIMPPNGIFD